MAGIPLIAAMASVALVIPPFLPGPLGPQPAPRPSEFALLVQEGTPEQECPRITLDPAPERPPRPDPPEYLPGERELGGVALASSGLVVPETAAQPPALTANTWLVADLDTGEVVGGCGPHEYEIPASTQKLLLAAALLDDLDPDRVVEVLPEDLDYEPGSSAVGLVSGGEYSVETLWLGLLLSSGNDAANVLARLGGGEDGREGGLRAMNEQARRLGAYQTFAATPSGLDGPGQFTSAYDLALIARQLFDRDDFLRYAQTLATDIPAQPNSGAGGFQIQNDNGLLRNYPGALGGKTGFTDLARHSFVGAAERDGRRLVVTLLGAERQPLVGWQQAAELLDWGFTVPAGEAVGRLVTPEEVAEVGVSSTTAPTAEPPAGNGELRAEGRQPESSPVNAATMAIVLLAGGIAGLMALVVTRRRRG